MQGLTLGENQSRQDIKVFLGPGGAIEVKVRDLNNMPFAGATVTAYEEGTSVAGRGAGIRGRTDGDGKATLSRVKPGAYNLSIQARRAAQQVKGGVYVSPGRTAFESVTIEEGYPVSVRLTAANGNPVKGASLSMKNGQGIPLSIPGGRFGRSDENVYPLGNLSPGAYTLKAEWDGKGGTAVFNVNKNGTIPVKLKEE